MVLKTKLANKSTKGAIAALVCLLTVGGQFAGASVVAAKGKTSPKAKSTTAAQTTKAASTTKAAPIAKAAVKPAVYPNQNVIDLATLKQFNLAGLADGVKPTLMFIWAPS